MSNKGGINIPFYGNKEEVLPEIQKRFGNDRNTVFELCGGTGAFVLNYPQINSSGNRVRRLYNDLESLLVNFLRLAQKASADELDRFAEIASAGHSEIELCASHRHLRAQRESLREMLVNNINYYDVQLAAIYFNTTLGWIGGGMGFDGINVYNKMPQAANNRTKNEILADFQRLKKLATGLQTFCGDFERPLMSKTQLRGKIAVLFDPSYPTVVCNGDYAVGGNTVLLCKRTRDRALELGKLPNARVAWCGYHRFFDQYFPSDWERFRWETSGGYAVQSADGRGRINAGDECIWFSPGCLKPDG